MFYNDFLDLRRLSFQLIKELKSPKKCNIVDLHIFDALVCELIVQ